MFQRIWKVQLIVSVCYVALLSGCASAPKTIEITRLVPLSAADAKVTEKGVSIEVTPLDSTTIGRYPQLSETVKLKVKTIVGELDKSVTFPNVLLGATLATKITNNTGHILNLAGTLINLTIQGQDYPQATKEGVLNTWAFRMKESYPLSPGVPPGVIRKVQRAAFWDESARIPPGRSKEVFIVFNVELHKGMGETALTIYDLVTQTDAAGNPTERASFEFTFMEKTQTMTMSK